jgi:hypothetical protein
LPFRETANPAQHLLHEQHFGQVALDCIFISSQAAATCRTGDVRGSDFLSDGAMQWLQDLSPPYPPGPDHRWHVIIEDFTGQAPGRRIPKHKSFLSKKSRFFFF